jgi:hypothetical protein
MVEMEVQVLMVVAVVVQVPLVQMRVHQQEVTVVLEPHL